MKAPGIGLPALQHLETQVTSSFSALIKDIFLLLFSTLVSPVTHAGINGPFYFPSQSCHCLGKKIITKSICNNHEENRVLSNYLHGLKKNKACQINLPSLSKEQPDWQTKGHWTLVLPGAWILTVIWALASLHIHVHVCDICYSHIGLPMWCCPF